MSFPALTSEVNGAPCHEWARVLPVPCDLRHRTGVAYLSISACGGREESCWDTHTTRPPFIFWRWCGSSVSCRGCTKAESYFLCLQVPVCLGFKCQYVIVIYLANCKNWLLQFGIPQVSLISTGSPLIPLVRTCLRSVIFTDYEQPSPLVLSQTYLFKPLPQGR